MRYKYRASGAELKVLKYTPRIMHCLPSADIHTYFNFCYTIIFLRLNNNRGFWYKLLKVENNTLFGYALMNGWWNYMPVRKNQIRRYM